MKRAFLALLFWSGVCAAHEVRPSYLELSETRPGEFSVLWKTPMQGDARLALEPRFSGPAEAVAKAARRSADAAIQTWILRAPALRGQSLRIEGLESTMTDALVRVAFADGSVWTQRLTPHRPEAAIPLQAARFDVAATYLGLGVEHILTGVDHLLFVLGLLILAGGQWRRLLATVTAFTAAHSITLALATLGMVTVPQRPVEAAIALSIAFVAVEILRARRGDPGLAARAPWLVAFAFGLLHGFGFAGALSEVGLPAGQIPLALLFFNLGVEAGQLAFVAAVLVVAQLLRRIRSGWLELVPPYVIGTVAMFWVFQRVASF